MLLSKFGVLLTLLLWRFQLLVDGSNYLNIELCGGGNDAFVEPGDAASVTLSSGRGICLRSLYGFPLDSYVYITSLRRAQIILGRAAYVEGENFIVDEQGEGLIFKIETERFSMGSPHLEPEGYSVEIFNRVIWCNRREELAPESIDYGVFVASNQQSNHVNTPNCTLTIFGQINLVRVTILTKPNIAKNFKFASNIFEDNATIGSSVKLFVQNELQLEYVGEKPLTTAFVMKFEAINKSCTEQPGEVPNAFPQTSTGPWEVGDEVLYTCKFGYQPALSPNIKRCDFSFEDNKVEWLETATCISERCKVSDETAKIENGSARVTQYSPGSNLDYTCDEGLEKATIVRCQEDYTWSDMPLCTIKSTSLATVPPDDTKIAEQQNIESSLSMTKVLYIVAGLIALGVAIAGVTLIAKRRSNANTTKAENLRGGNSLQRRLEKERVAGANMEFQNERASQGSLVRSEPAVYKRGPNADLKQGFPKIRSRSNSNTRIRTPRKKGSKRIR